MTLPDQTGGSIPTDALRAEARKLLSFFAAHAVRPAGGFYALGDSGQPIGDGRQELYYVCRMVHCFAAGHAVGEPGAAQVVDHGIDCLINQMHDTRHGGFFWEVHDDTPTRAEKLAYGHVFVLLAAASAQEVGHAKAPQLRDLVMQVIDDHFWDDAAGALREEFAADWSPLSDYRGQNANMHGTEAFMAAYEAFGDPRYLAMAERIAELIINRHARAADWVVIEHFHSDWSPDLSYSGDPMFRPAGTTPGHALEWSRLLIQLWHLGGKAHDWMPDAAAGLFRTACQTGWDDASGGFYYTLDFDKRPDQTLHLWWPLCEAVAAASVLSATLGDPDFGQWFDRTYAVLQRDYIDPAGGWWPVPPSERNSPDSPFGGKPDIYHALQSCLIPTLPPDTGMLPGLKATAGSTNTR